MPLEFVVIDPDTISLLGGLVRAHRGADLRTSGEISDGADVDLEIAYDEALQRYVATSVRVQRAAPGTEVTSRLIREVKVQEAIVSVALRDLIRVYSDDEDVDDQTALTGEAWLARVEPMHGRHAPEVRYDASVIYTIARLGNWPPLATVAKHLGVSQSTATRLVADARAHRLL